MSGRDSCLSLSEVERVAADEFLPGEVMEHLDSCAACQQQVQQAREDQVFVKRVRAMAEPTLGPVGAPRIAGYRIVSIVSSGAQGIVYRAVQESTARVVAIKAINQGDGESTHHRLRAQREAEIAARLRHPNIVNVFESRTVGDGRTIMVMEFIDGVPIDGWQPPGDTSAERQRALLNALHTVCLAIHHAHLNGVIHRDLKPENVLVARDGRPVVLDFGIAKIDGLRLTLTGEFAGTPAYASPEQVGGHSDDVDALTDVYSLGVLMYRLLCGKMPYELNGTIFDIAHTIENVEPTPLRQQDHTLSPDLDAIVMRAIRKDKAFRYQSAAVLARDIERYLVGEPVEARSGSGWYLLRKAIVVNRRRLAWVGGAAIFALAATIAVIIALADAAAADRRAQLEREMAMAERIRGRAVTELLREALPNVADDQRLIGRPVDAGLKRLFYRLETGAFADDPALDQSLRRMWGSIYTDFGSGKGAGLVEYSEVALRNGLVRLRMEHGGDHPDIAAAMHELAGVLLVRKRESEAEHECRAALAMRERLGGSDSILAIESRGLLARILRTLGRSEEAVHEADQVIGVMASLPEAESDLTIADMLEIKAHDRWGAADDSGAESYFRESLTRRLRRLPPEDPELIRSLSDAAAFAEQHPETEFAGLLARAWRCRPEELGDRIGTDLLILSVPERADWRIVEEVGRTDALGRLLDLSRELLGPADHAIIDLLMAQVRTSDYEGRLEQRAQASLEAADLLARRFGPDDLSVLTCLETAALALGYTARVEEAVVLARRVCAIWESIPESSRDRLAEAMAHRHLAMFLLYCGRYEEGGAEAERVIGALSSILGPEHYTIALMESALAFAQVELGAMADADLISARTLEFAEVSEIIAPDQLGTIRFIRGHVLLRNGRLSEARTLLLDAWDNWYSLTGTEYAWRNVLLRDLAECSEALGEVDEARRWRSMISSSHRVAESGAS